jgi:DNA-3-methyladenine glycosylase II
MFSFGRQDVFPIDDLGIRQGMKRFYKVESEGKDLRKDLTKIAENWRPYRTIASKLIWLGKDNL